MKLNLTIHTQIQVTGTKDQREVAYQIQNILEGLANTWFVMTEIKVDTCAVDNIDTELVSE